jgi:Tfp pilus assembly protein PilN
VTVTWDLLPARCRAIFARRRARRIWTRAYFIGVTLALSASGAMYLHARAQEHRREILADRVEEHWNRNEEAKRLREEIRELEGTITRYQRLAWPVRVTDAIGVLAPLVPPEATLTSLTIVPREERLESAGGPSRRGSKGRSSAGTRTILAIEIEGIALSDEVVARFVQGVESSPVFSAVGMDYARSRDVDGVEAREFRVTCQIDMSRRVVFTEADEEGALP